MNKHFFDEKSKEQIKILEDEKFFDKNELEQIDSLREKGFFELTPIQRMEFLEKTGIFYLDINDDPPTIPLTLEMVDYLDKKLKSKINRQIAYGSAERFLKSILRDKKLIIKDIHGMEHLKDVSGGAIITCNHFNPFDTFAIENVFREAGLNKKKKLYKVIREGNYTNYPGLYGFFFKNCDTLPLASNKRVMVEFMRAVDTILKRGDYILIYPEQSMWFNYKKPKPLQNGAFKLSTRSKAPIIPAFICFEDSDVIDEEGICVQAYTIYIEKPIYPDENKTDKENIEEMKKKNYEIWKEIYEKFYNKPVEYITETNIERIAK